ncbi:GTP-binding protein [Deinococcus fonticola]|uniref:GTP-binding protein n=1 Tax=Deinococcus fonticola TaxID=2528713 RepID=UPI0030B84123
MNLHGFDEHWIPPPVQTNHTPGLKSFTLEADQCLSLWGWQALTERIVTRPGHVLRVKGHLSLDAHPERLLVQAVRDVMTIEPTGQPRDNTCQLVVIGRDLNRSEEREFFARALTFQPSNPLARTGVAAER